MVKLTKYIEKLQELLEEHGVVNYIESDYCIIHEDDLEEWNESDYQKVICIN